MLVLCACGASSQECGRHASLGNATVCLSNYIGDGYPAHNVAVFVPDDASDVSLDAVVYIQGSGFCGFDMTLSRALSGSWNYPCSEVVRRGMVCAAIGYRSESWPAQHEDARAAIRWLRATSTSYKVNASRIGLWGHSSGGSVAAFWWAATETEDAALNMTSIGPYANTSACVAAVVALSGQYHPYPAQTPECPEAETWLKTKDNAGCEPLYTRSDESVAAKMNPGEYLATTNDIPISLAVGLDDRTVSACNTFELFDEAAAVDAPVTLSAYPDRGHMDYLLEDLATETQKFQAALRSSKACKF